MGRIAETAKIYRNVKLRDCDIMDYTCVADDCDLISVVMNEHSEFGRRTIVRDSTIGYGSYTGENCRIKNAEIGKYTSIGWGVSVVGGDKKAHNYLNTSMYTPYWYKRTFGVEGMKMPEGAKIHIGNDVWIGCNVVILNGLTIGDGAVVGGVPL